jgi:hypothetical protein
MEEFVKLTLSRMDIGQILDGLHERMLVWRATQEYLETGYPQSSDCVEECADESEACAIADYYQYLIDTVKKQLEFQPSNHVGGKKYFYITLLHGRKTPTEEMDEKGSQGPAFGPYSELYSIYSHSLLFLRQDGQSDEFTAIDGLLYYDGVYYGDWVVLCELKQGQSIAVFDKNKAIRPKEA